MRGKERPTRRSAKPAQAKIEAKPPVARKSRKSEASTVRDLKERLAEALAQQAATSEILRVISSSLSDLQPIMDTVAEYAARLCEASDAQIFLLEGGTFHLAASHGPLPPARLVPVTRGSVAGRAVIDRQTIHVRDIATEPAVEFPDSLAKGSGWRTVLGEPLLRRDVPIGTIVIRRTEVRPFSDKQLALLKTFADQAVIAIENVRLFTELQEKNRALSEAHAQVSEALEQQTATAEILSVISSSPTDVQPVFDTIVKSAARLCDATVSGLTRFDGNVLEIGATAEEAIGQASRVAIARAVGNRSTMSVPMLREGQPIGAITLGRAQPGSYSTKHLALLQTFADQAVIAIENVRLFTALQTSNRELTTALDKQTATSDILRVISRSQTDVQPVFDTILTSAFSLLGAHWGYLTRIAGDQIEIAALRAPDDATDAAMRASFPRLLQSTSASAQAIRERTPINIGDYETDPRVSEVGRTIGRFHGYKSWIIVPMLRHDEGVGTIVMVRRTPGGFAPDEITLLQTFADQAVIAIENARLLTELHARTAELTQSVSELRALGEVGQAISSTLDLRTVLNTIVARATELSGTGAGVVYEYDEQREVFLPRATQHLEAEIVETMLATPVRKGEGATGRLAEVQEPIQLPDILQAPAESGCVAPSCALDTGPFSRFLSSERTTSSAASL